MEEVERARANFAQARGLLLQAVGHTPADKLTWSPSPSARSILNQVVHCAVSLEHMHGIMRGVMFKEPSTADADRYFRDVDSRKWTLESALELFDKNGDAFLDWLDSVTAESLTTSVELPFGMGQVPVSVMIQTPGDHTKWHVAQIHYIQTIYGDRAWL